MANEHVALTAFQFRVLKCLADSPQYPDDLYPLLWPRGKFVLQRDPGSSGGPSRRACAVNWHLGKLHPWVRRPSFLDKDKDAGKWILTKEGRAAFERGYISDGK